VHSFRQTDNQPWAAGSGDTRHNVSFLFLLTQYQITVIPYTLKQFTAAGTTGSAFTGRGYVDAVFGQCFKQCLVGADCDHLILALNLHLEWLIVGLVSGVTGTKVFEVDAAGGPVP
jgi:hypothetical protein